MLGMVPAVPIPDKKFMSMFKGLVDGDGYIERGPQKQYNKSSIIPRSTIRARLVLRLHSRDIEFITYLTKVLGSNPQSWARAFTSKYFTAGV